MGKDGVIKTGVDKLVELIKDKKKISINDAAKELSVSNVVIEEWANFLEEKDIISVEYKLATPYLIKKEITKAALNKKEKEFHGRKEGFLRKVDSALKHIENETGGLKDLKKEFKFISTEIEEDVRIVENDLKKLERYEKLKKEIDNQIISQQEDFAQKMGNLKKELAEEEG